MVKNIKKAFFLGILLAVIIIFYAPFFIGKKLPIPADTIIGLYYPYRDFYAASYPNGVPFKNFLITDPVRQTYIWKELAVDLFNSGNLPLWNPYEMAGKPLLANFQSAIFSPLNFILFIKPFYLSWSVFIIFQSLFLGIFSYLYLKNLRLSASASVLGALSIAFSGVTISWLEWGTIVSTTLWLPMILFSIDKLFSNVTNSGKLLLYLFLSTLFLTFSFFGGNLQIFFYLYAISIGYFLLRWFETKKNPKVLLFFIISNAIFFVITFVQWYPTLQFILLSERSFDRDFLTVEGWFIPWKHLIQFIAPDFFGNPATLNYWGTWNYGELVGYIGVIPLILSFYSLLRRSSTGIFFLAVIFVSLLFALPTGISSLPFILHLPLISSAQPTRLLFPIAFSLSILSAFGLEYLLDNKKNNAKNYIPLSIFIVLFLIVWLFVFSKTPFIFKNSNDILVAKRNLIVPTVMFFLGLIFIVTHLISGKKLIKKIIVFALILVTIVDLLRFSGKFVSFSPISYLYPETKVISYLQQMNGTFRIASLDNRIMPPNFLTHYKLQSIEGYDPLYLKTYAEFISVMENQGSDSNTVMKFNRIITPHNYNSNQFDFLNTRFVLSLDEVKSPKLVKVFEEGQTKVYENIKAFPRAFFVENVIYTKNELLELSRTDLSKSAIISDIGKTEENLSVGTVEKIVYKENSVTIDTRNNGSGFLVLSDVYYPTWRAYIDGKKTPIYLTNHAFRGIFVPSGDHRIQFIDALF